MTLTLASDLNTADCLLEVNDATLASLDDVLQIDSELVVVRGDPSVNGKLLVGRGYLGTERAAHASGAELAPFSISSPGGGGFSSVTGSGGGSVSNPTSMEVAGRVFADGAGVGQTHLIGMFRAQSTGLDAIPNDGEFHDVPWALMNDAPESGAQYLDEDGHIRPYLGDTPFPGGRIILHSFAIHLSLDIGGGPPTKVVEVALGGGDWVSAESEIAPLGTVASHTVRSWIDGFSVGDYIPCNVMIPADEASPVDVDVIAMILDMGPIT